MKFTLLEEEEEEEEPKIELFLSKRNGGVILKGIDENGIEKNIMEFKNGKFHRCRFAQLKRLKTDEKGKILEMKQKE